jgi:YD repeat-containing protein
MKTQTSVSTGLAWPLVAAFLLALALPAIALAHASVYPSASTPGAYEKYVLRVPNEKGVPTTRVELRFPTEVRVISFSDVAGWTLEVVRDSAGRVTSAVWTGTLPPERFVELPFIAVNPAADGRLVWPAYQTYADGERVEWIGPEDAPAPASATTIGGAETGASSSVPLYLGAGALLLALLSLGLVLRR